MKVAVTTKKAAVMTGEVGRESVCKGGWCLAAIWLGARCGLISSQLVECVFAVVLRVFVLADAGADADDRSARCGSNGGWMVAGGGRGGGAFGARVRE